MTRRALLAAALLGAAGCTGGSASDMETVKAEVRAKYPDVKGLSTRELADWLADAKRKPPVLVDARSEAEYAVSRIPGARRAEKVSALADVPKDAPIVAYCSVGYRSAILARKLADAGYTNVVNLEGSIFEWANDGRPLEKDGGKAERVHPYDETWGKLLKPDKRAN